MKRVGLKILRTRSGLNQTQMGEICGVSYSMYSLVESGKRKGSPELWNALQAAFNLTAADVGKLQDGKEIKQHGGKK